MDAVVHACVANKREMDATGEEALDDLAGGGDFYFYEDVWVITPKAPEGAREEVDAWGCRRANVNRSGLEPGERLEFFLGGGKRGEGLARVRCKNAPRVGELAAAPVAFDEPLACSRLEKAQVLARARLSDSDGARGSRDASVPVELDQEAKSFRVPKKGERAIAHGDMDYC